MFLWKAQYCLTSTAKRKQICSQALYLSIKVSLELVNIGPSAPGPLEKMNVCSNDLTGIGERNTTEIWPTKVARVPTMR